jgi:UDP-N-acetylmuramoyl-L-alanyl-D-glutamate--2,6-diaminopimelate ligase
VKRITDIIANCKILKTIGNLDVEIESLVFDSRKVGSGALYVAQRGVNADGHQFISMAITKGAVAIVCEELPEQIVDSITYIVVSDSSEVLGMMSSEFFGNPSSKLKLVGITGTNGKTTTVTLLHKLFSSLGYKCGMLSTVHNKIGEELIASSHTTPDAVQLNSLLNDMVLEGCDYAFMEVSSHAIVQHRTSGCA